MRTALVIIGLIAAASAHPRPDPQFEVIGDPSPPVTSKTPTRTRKFKWHKEPTPTFELPLCDCPKPIVPINLFSKKEVRISDRRWLWIVKEKIRPRLGFLGR